MSILNSLSVKFTPRLGWIVLTNNLSVLNPVGSTPFWSIVYKLKVDNPTFWPPITGVLTVTVNEFAVVLPTDNMPLLNLLLEVDAGSLGRGYKWSEP